MYTHTHTHRHTNILGWTVPLRVSCDRLKFSVRTQAWLKDFQMHGLFWRNILNTNSWLTASLRKAWQTKRLKACEKYEAQFPDSFEKVPFHASKKCPACLRSTRILHPNMCLSQKLRRKLKGKREIERERKKQRREKKKKQITDCV